MSWVQLAVAVASAVRAQGEANQQRGFFGKAAWLAGNPPAAPMAATPPAPTSAPGAQPEVPMSMWGDIARAVAPAVGQYFGGSAGADLGSQIARISAGMSTVPAPGTGGVMPAMAMLPSLGGTVGAVAGTVVGAAVLGARTIYRSASIYCRRHPAWCAQIGGTAAIAGMIQQGTLPPIRRRRARGISPGEFKGFRKVHKVLSGFCAPRMRVRKGR